MKRRREKSTSLPCKRSTNPRLEVMGCLAEAWSISTKDGKIEMQGQSKTFAQHVAAAWREGLSMGAYAKKHGLAASTLYRWQQKLRPTQGAVDGQGVRGMQARPVGADTPTQLHTQPARLGGTVPADTRQHPPPHAGSPACEGKFVALRVIPAQNSSTGTGTRVNDKRSAPGTRPQTRPHPFGAPRDLTPSHTHGPNRLAGPDDPGGLGGPSHCTLLLPGAIRVQMPAPPDPAWLVALSVCAQGAY